MIQQLIDLLKQPNGVFIDTNLLIPLIVGRVDPRQVSVFKRTSRYTQDDYVLLEMILEQARKLYTSPHVLTECVNFLDMLNEPYRTEALKTVRRFISDIRLEEVTEESRVLTERVTFEKLGLADTAIIETAVTHQCAVLTDDFPLYAYLLAAGIGVIKFSHLRDNF